jgi:hypothetical protein
VAIFEEDQKNRGRYLRHLRARFQQDVSTHEAFVEYFVTTISSEDYYIHFIRERVNLH